MALRILEGGLLTTVQDLGRFGYQRSGVSPSGALDVKALLVANRLVGNAVAAAGLEMTLSGATVEFTDDAVIAATGADMAATVNGSPVETYRAVPVKRGDVLAFGLARSGCRAYLAVSGGLDLPLVMGSRSTHLAGRIGGLEGRALRAGDVLPVAASILPPAKLLARTAEPPAPPAFPLSLRAVPGPQAERFGEIGLDCFYGNLYEVSPRSDRMGSALAGPPVPCVGGTDIISDGIPLGAVQIVSDGMPVVMLADRQTCGGYAKIATVIGPDIGIIAQARPGDSLRFVRISVESARRVALSERKENEKLRRRLAV